MNMARINDITPEEWNSLENKKSKATDIQIGGDHYAKQSIQPAEIIQKLKLSWCKSNAIKYILRAGNKGPSPDEDLKKAIHYLELELQIEKEK